MDDVWILTEVDEVLKKDGLGGTPDEVDEGVVLRRDADFSRNDTSGCWGIVG